MLGLNRMALSFPSFGGMASKDSCKLMESPFLKGASLCAASAGTAYVGYPCSQISASLLLTF